MLQLWAVRLEVVYLLAIHPPNATAVDGRVLS